MSAYTTHSKMPTAQPHPQLHRRPPFSNAINQASSPTKQEKPKIAPSDPPLPRQNSKTTPPSPPKVITDKNRLLEFHRVGFLGEVCMHSFCTCPPFDVLSQGGFARVYEVKDVRGTRHACKVVTKSSLKTKKAKTKVRLSSRPNAPADVPLAVRRNQDPSFLGTPQHRPLLRMLRRRRQRIHDPRALS